MKPNMNSTNNYINFLFFTPSIHFLDYFIFLSFELKDKLTLINLNNEIE